MGCWETFCMVPIAFQPLFCTGPLFIKKISCVPHRPAGGWNVLLGLSHHTLASLSLCHYLFLAGNTGAHSRKMSSYCCRSSAQRAFTCKHTHARVFSVRINFDCGSFSSRKSVPFDKTLGGSRIPAAFASSIMQKVALTWSISPPSKRILRDVGDIIMFHQITPYCWYTWWGRRARPFKGDRARLIKISVRAAAFLWCIREREQRPVLLPNVLQLREETNRCSAKRTNICTTLISG